MPAESESIGANSRLTDAAFPEYPLRRSKIERPILPLETLRRDRLLDWLDAMVRRRTTYVVAEAGFGKTTLLADFARRTRFRTIWYRIDEDDIDPITFLRYLIAACRAVEPEALPRAVAMLAEAATRPLTWEGLLEVVCSELGPIASEPTIVFFDDYHLAEEFAAVRQIVERLVARAPEPVTFVVASRRTPNLAVARLRASDRLAELGREELRFDQEETGRLFREVYGQPLEADVLADLQSKTEGWVASLQLVKTAVRGRAAPEIRRFVRTLSAGEGELYDYLAEEVIADLPVETQDFLTRISILDEIDLSIAAAAAGTSLVETRLLVNGAQRLGLVTRTARVLGPARLHPLVREFLEVRLTSEIGEVGVIELHRLVAALYEPISWRSAARHWAAAGDRDDVCRVVQAATGTILGTGEYDAADVFISSFGDTDPNAWFDIVRSRIAFSAGRTNEAVLLADRARALAALVPEDHVLRQVQGLQAAFIAFETSGPDEAVAAAVELEKRAVDDEARAIARALRAISEDLDLRAELAAVEDVLRLTRNAGHSRFEGIAQLNIAVVLRLLGEREASMTHAGEASDLLREYGTTDEHAAASITLAQLHAAAGDWEQAAERAQEALIEWPSDVMAAEVADVFTMYGDPRAAKRILHSTSRGDILAGCHRSLVLAAFARLAMAEGRLQEAENHLNDVADRPVYPGFRSLHGTLLAHLSVLVGRPTAREDVEEAARVCRLQRAEYWLGIVQLLNAAIASTQALSEAIATCSGTTRSHLSVVAEVLVSRLDSLDERALEAIEMEVVSRPDRWRPILRRSLAACRHAKEAITIGCLLERVADASDIPSLRRVAQRAPRSSRAGQLGRSVIRRLAPKVAIDDLGPVTISVDGRVLPGAEVRRKVLGLLCYLLTRPRFAATADQVIEALWPGLDPATGGNSLNQTIYFLRRVLEPHFADGTTAGYVRHDGDLIWLDQDLVTSRSQECRSLLTRITRESSPALVDALAATYSAPFALDFAYDDWAASYRDSLHARYLSVIESSICESSAKGDLGRAIALAQRAIQVDPDAVQIELCLLKLYRQTGAHSAAAEQYSHYVAAIREETGADPPPLADL